MTSRTAIVLLAAALACTSMPPSPTKHVVFLHPNGQKAAEGDFTEYATNVVARDLPPWKEFLRSGRWQYWYADGKPRATITYAVSTYDECCVAGPCAGHYERVLGKPVVFDESGKPMTLPRAPRLACMQTNCAGCTQVYRPRFVLPADLAPEWNPHDPGAK